MIKKLEKLQNWQKTTIVLLSDVLFSAFCFYGALALRYESIVVPSVGPYQLLKILVCVVSIQSASFYFSGLYRGIWRYSSTPDLIRLLKGCTIAAALSLVGLFLMTRLENIPRTVFVVDWLLLVVSLGGTRFAYRVFRDYSTINKLSSDGERVVIVGTDDIGEQLFREIRHSPELGLKVVAFVDHHSNRKGKFIHGIKIFGNINDLAQIIQKTGSTKVYVALKNASKDTYQTIFNLCKDKDIEVKMLPRMTDSLQGEAALSSLRSIEPEDLLGRDEVILDTQSVESFIQNKRVFVSGAGGSIGSELCHQIASFKPSQIIFYELTEYNLYKLEKDIKKKYPTLNYTLIIGDVRSLSSLEEAFQKHKPNIIFHAAAYKHVPLMEQNPLEAVHTNVSGTMNVARTAQKHHCEKFVLVSTDKAVNPTNVMGATKRIAEMTCLAQQKKDSVTKFMIVRFGNVLGSSGSVIPLFKEQIQNGGPVTVTHPDIERYFMSIPEASRLVLQAGALGNGGEIFVLDMGKPILIRDLASHMIRLSGFRVGKDINIEYTGLRPGEKLYEELLIKEESILPTLHPLVKVAKSRELCQHFEQKVQALLSLPKNTHDQKIREEIQVLVPEYNYKKQTPSLSESSTQHSQSQKIQ
jgi:FlaA1/EpsC-like NDP-sugar epimerase